MAVTMLFDVRASVVCTYIYTPTVSSVPAARTERKLWPISTFDRARFA